MKDHEGREFGKIGNIVRRRTKYGVIEYLYTKPKYPNTLAQQAQKSKQKPLMEFLRPIKNDLKALYLEEELTKKRLGPRSYLDAARSQNLSFAFDETIVELDPEEIKNEEQKGNKESTKTVFVFRPERVLISKGSLVPPCNVRVSYIEGEIKDGIKKEDRLQFTWDDNSRLQRAYSYDNMTFLLYNPETKFHWSSHNKSSRSTGKYEEKLNSNFMKGRYLLYVSCTNAKKEMVSDSVCFGEFELGSAEMEMSTRKKQKESVQGFDILTIARNMKAEGTSTEFIAKMTGLPIEKIMALD